MIKEPLIKSHMAVSCRRRTGCAYRLRRNTGAVLLPACSSLKLDTLQLRAHLGFNQKFSGITS